MSVVVAGCKVNLGLRITGVRENGYHELDSLFWPLPRPCDRLHISETGAGGIVVQCDTPGINLASNTLTKAYAALAERVPGLPGLEVRLIKGIPAGAGLGGGSSDAAALLQWLNKRLPAPLTDEELAAVALKVGADTPFFLRNTPCRVRGIGEIIEPCAADELAGIRLVLVCPDIHASTPQAYADYDASTQASNTIPGQNCLTKPESKANGTFLSGVRIALNLHNDLEAVVFSRHPQLAEIKANLLRLGACAVAMSGSGSSIVALFARESHVESQAAAAMLQGENRRVYAHVL
jgi:4-diphosphocytidyl-2-C-methyl-D-erythritol kinase